MSYWYLFAFCAGAYLIGNINFSIIITKFLFKKNIRAMGSGNPGATNMLRHYGFKWGIFTLFLDSFKSIFCVLIAMWVYGGFHYDWSPFHQVSSDRGLIAAYSCGLAVAIGHCFPVFMKFKGGKGVGTTVGVFFVTNPLLALIGLLLGILFVGIFQYASLASIIFTTLLVLWEGFVKSPHPAVEAMLIAFYFFILLMHRGNIYKLLAGKENRASLVKKKIKPVISDPSIK